MDHSAEDRSQDKFLESKCCWPSEELRAKYDWLVVGDTCPHEPKHQVGDDHFCIFHLPLAEKRRDPALAEEFERKFKRLFDEGNRDFLGFEFPDKSNFERWDFRPHPESGVTGDQEQPTLRPSINFTMAVFGDDVRFDYATFGNNASFWDATFGDYAWFENATFGSDASFWDATFGDTARFLVVIFGDRAVFKGANFGDCAVFGGTTFGDSARFESATFGDDALFWRATFGDDASFLDSSFRGRLRLDEVHFKGMVTFQGIKGVDLTTLESRPQMKKAVMEGKGQDQADRAYDIIVAKPPDVSFRKIAFQGPALFHDLDLARVRFQQVDLANVSFLNSRIAETRFISCLWWEDLENPGCWWPFRFRRPRLLFDERLWRAKKKGKPLLINHERSVKSLSKEERAEIESETGLEEKEKIRRGWLYMPGNFGIGPEDLNASDIEVLALQLKESLERTKDPISAGDFHFAVMEMKREQARDQKRHWLAAGLWLYKMLNGYGERPGRTLIWIGLSIILAALVYVAVPLIYGGELRLSGRKPFTNIEGWERFKDSLVYAFQHVLPFKFGASDLKPVGRVMTFLTYLQTFVGTSLVGMFLLALRSRFRR